MANLSHLRSSDRIKSTDFQAVNFKLRNHPPVAQLTKLFMAASITVLVISASLYYNVLTGFYICVLSGGVVWFVSKQLNRLQHILTATEFLNALLTSVINRDHQFSCIVRNDGEIVYLNTLHFSACSLSSLRRLT